MSDSGFPNLTPSTATQLPDQKVSAPKYNAQIQDLPQDLQNLQQTKKIQGKITAVQKNGEVTLKTDQGTVTAQFVTNTSYKQGQIVDLYLAKGNPPQNAVITLSSQNQLQQTIPQAVLQEIGSIPQITTITIEDAIGAQTTLTPLSSNQISSVTNSYTEILETSLSTLPLQESITLSTLPDLQSLSSALPLENIPFSFFNTATNQNLAFETGLGDNLAQSSLLSLTEHPLTISFKNIAAYVLKSEASNFISTSPHEAEERPTAHQHSTSLITINDIKSPTPSLSTTGENTGLPSLLSSQIGEIVGFVEGLSADRHLPVISLSGLHAHSQYFVLNIDIKDIQTGSLIKFTPLQTGTELPAIAPLLFNITGNPLLPDRWGNFEELISTLQQTAPNAAQAVSNMTLTPTAPQNMGSIALFFVAALRSGDLQGWLGSNAANALKKSGKDSLLNALRQEGFSHTSIDTAGQDWRTSSLPLSWGNEIHKVILHVRQDSHDKSQDQDNEKNHTRFVIDLSLSNIGPVQIDALHKKIGNNQEHLDLILRTNDSFSKAVQNDMAQRYQSALEETNMSGYLLFQTSPENWVKISPDQEGAFSENI